MANSKVMNAPNADKMASGGRIKQRKWEVFSGKNKFGCNGRCMCAPDYQGFLFCLILIVVTGGMFFVLDCPYLAVNVSPAIPVFGGILFIIIVGSLCQTALIDPGIIPRATLPEALETDRLHQLDVQSRAEEGNNNSSYTPPRYKEVEIKGRKFKLSYCQTCQMYRPPRASHCSRCNNCVERFDHHCPMVGNCIGKRNYRYFFTFVSTTAIMCLYVLGCNITVVVLRALESNVGDAFKNSVGSLIEGIICLGSLASVGGLACYHSYLVAQEMTTNEDIKGTYNPKKFKDGINPYSHGNCCRNCLYVLFAPRHPSLIDRRGFVDPTEEAGFQRVPQSVYPPVAHHV